MAAEFSPTHDVDSASDVDSSAVPLPPVGDVLFAFSTPETVHSNRICGIQTKDERRKKIVDGILQKFNNGKLQKGLIKAVAAQFNMSRRWVGELWRIAKGQLVRGQAINVQCRWQGNAGKKPKDNAKPHVDINDPEFVSAAKEGDWDIQLQYQLPNSLDLNVLDLGFFRAIDAIQDKTAPKTLGDLIVNVQTAFDQLTPQKLNHVFLTY
ncbi:unnamed protein product [Cuscuta campestris]|uniref:DUF7769 domain-containing protein n=1 Tax=Cuscuta campestris TaxID=132261 RepID=A0A484LKH8_9ASTE|nr:unnamed protein product [Cuscuta campestris]